jgi:hypothetical protein
MNDAYSTHGRDENVVQNSGSKTLKDASTWETRRKWENNIKDCSQAERILMCGLN